jgi:hypothetical protein
MIPALVIGRAGSSGFPGKNVYPVVGRPLMVYPILAARHAETVDSVYISTDSLEMEQVAVEEGCEAIERPLELASDEALAEDAFQHGYRVIKDRSDDAIEMIVLLFCNSATIRPGLVDECVAALRANPELDSACSVSQYNMWSPLRARQIDEQGLLAPFVPPEMFEGASCDRDSQGDVYFADCSAFVVRPRCLEDLEYGVLPYRWQGRKIAPIEQWGGLDVDGEWQIPQVEYWLRRHGFSEEATPYGR